MSIPNAKAPLSEEAAAVAPSTTPESLGWQLRGALPPMRLHSVTLCDQDGDVLWLSEGALGPDEHGFVTEAIGTLTSDHSLAHCELDLQDGRYGVFLAVRAPQGDLVALAMILAETKGLGANVGTRILTQQVRLILQKIAIHLRPQAAIAIVPPPAPPVAAPVANPVAANAQPATNSARAKTASASPAGGATAASTAHNGLPSSPQLTQAAQAAVASTGAPSNASAAQAAPSSRAPSKSAAKSLKEPAPAAPQMRAPLPPSQPDLGSSTTSLLSPLAVDDILSFELVDEETSPSQAPALEDLAEFEDRFNIANLALEDEPVVVAARPPAPHSPKLDTPQPHAFQKSSAPPAPAIIVPSMDAPVLSTAPVVARAETPPEPVAKKLEPITQSPPPMSATDAAIKALREPSNAYAAMRYGAIPVEKPAPPPVAAAARPIAPKLNSHVDPAFKDLALSVQLLSKLRPGGRTRRYEVLLRNKQQPKALVAAAEIIRSLDEKSDLDGFVVSQLLTWLAENPRASEREPLTFSINLSPRALQDERFPEFVSSWLRKTGVAAESIGFELAESLCVQHKEHAQRFLAACEKLGCFVVLDDFTMETRALELLRSKALKLVKLDSRLTNEAMKDKLSQALVIAISQAAKVLGVHCAAKKIESQMVRRWVTAIGFDFGQGTLFEGPQQLSDLLSS